MPSRPLDPLTMLAITLSATISRHKYTDDPAPVIAEQQQLAGEHTDILAKEAGRWAGFHETDPHCTVLVAALKEIPGASEHVQLGRDRFRAPTHRTPPLRL